MDTLLSQLKGQGSPFSSPLPISIAEKLLDTIHLLSQSTLLVAQQLQGERTNTLPTLKSQPISLPTPKSSPFPTPKTSPPPASKSSPPPAPKKTSKPKPTHTTPILSWVPRSPEHYTDNSSSESIRSTIAMPTTNTPHTKKDRKPKSKRTKPSTQPNPSPTPTTTTPMPTPRPAPTPIEKPAPTQPKPPTPMPTPRPAPMQTQGSAQPEPQGPLTSPNPLPTSTHTTTSKLSIPEPFTEQQFRHARPFSIPLSEPLTQAQVDDVLARHSIRPSPFLVPPKPTTFTWVRGELMVSGTH